MNVPGGADYAKSLALGVNRIFGVYNQPWQVASITTTTVLCTIWLWKFYNQDESKL